jgi:hypothetical protein
LAGAIGVLMPRLGDASGLLLGNLTRLPGVAAEGMAGAQVAMTSGPPAVMLNPAGLARAARSDILLDAGAVAWTEWDEGANQPATVRMVPGAAGWSTGPERSRPRLGYGVLLGPPEEQWVAPVLSRASTIRGADLPPAVSGTQPYDTLFPDGIALMERRANFAQLDSIFAAAGFGLRVSDWMRWGASVRLERVALRLREDLTRDFAAAPPANTNTLTGSVVSSTDYAGEANRAVIVIGFQVDLAPAIVLGVVSRLPSETLGGAGSARVEQAQNLLVSQGGTPIQQASARIHAAQDALRFDLRAPGSWRIGLAFLFDSAVFEFDIERTQRLGSYAVFPALHSQPPSTSAATFAPLEAGAVETLSYALGTAMALGDRGSLMFGFTTQSATAPKGDAVFRAMDLYRVTGAYYVTRGAGSGAMYAAYTTGESPPAGAAPADTAATPRPVRFSEWMLGVSGGWTY